MEARGSPVQQLPMQYADQLDPVPERNRAPPGLYSGLQHGIPQLQQTLLTLCQTEDLLKPLGEPKLFPRQLQKVKLCVCRQWVAGERKIDSSKPYK